MNFFILSWTALVELYLLTFSLASPINVFNEARKEPLVRLLYEYPQGTWIENIAVHESGELLVTHLTQPRLNQYDPFKANAIPETVHEFTGSLSLLGIAEIAPDSFAMLVGNVSLTKGAIPGSFTVWNVAFDQTNDTHANVHEIAALPDADFPNGLCTLPSSGTPDNLLYGDILKGAISFIDTTTGNSHVAVNDSLTAAGPSPGFGTAGVNGIHVVNGTLYFTDTGKIVFSSIPIHPDGTPAGAPHIIQRSQKSQDIFYFDDFTIKDDNAYLVTGAGNSIECIGLDGTPKARIIAGNLNSTQFAEPTSAACGCCLRLLVIGKQGALCLQAKTVLDSKLGSKRQRLYLKPLRPS